MSKKEIKSLVLLSGGLDCVVSLALAKEKLNPTFALTFDYGQKSLKKEIEASQKICQYYGLEHKIIKLDWLKEITKTALVSDDIIPTGEALCDEKNSAKAVWIPNRNGLFLNIAGAFAEAENFTHIIIGANKEEAQTFSDNTKEFINRINAEFEYSTMAHPQVCAPLIDCDKIEIVKLGIENNIPFNLLNSCYTDTKKHCGRCESCTRLKNALIANNAEQIINNLFED